MPLCCTPAPEQASWTTPTVHPVVALAAPEACGSEAEPSVTSELAKKLEVTMVVDAESTAAAGVAPRVLPACEAALDAGGSSDDLRELAIPVPWECPSAAAVYNSQLVSSCEPEKAVSALGGPQAPAGAQPSDEAEAEDEAGVAQLEAEIAEPMEEGLGLSLGGSSTPMLFSDVLRWH